MPATVNLTVTPSRRWTAGDECELPGYLGSGLGRIVANGLGEHPELVPHLFGELLACVAVTEHATGARPRVRRVLVPASDLLRPPCTACGKR